MTGSKILRILKGLGLAPEIPEDLYHLIKKAVSMRKHLELFRKDKDGKFRLILVESRIHRLARYYKVRASEARHQCVLLQWCGQVSYHGRWYVMGIYAIDTGGEQLFSREVGKRGDGWNGNGEQRMLCIAPAWSLNDGIRVEVDVARHKDSSLSLSCRAGDNVLSLCGQAGRWGVTNRRYVLCVCRKQRSCRPTGSTSLPQHQPWSPRWL